MIKRRDALKEMLEPISEQTRAEQRHSKPVVQAGSLKAMGMSLQSLSEEANEAELCERKWLAENMSSRSILNLLNRRS